MEDPKILKPKVEKDEIKSAFLLLDALEKTNEEMPDEIWKSNNVFEVSSHTFDFTINLIVEVVGSRDFCVHGCWELDEFPGGGDGFFRLRKSHFFIFLAIAREGLKVLETGNP